MTSSVKGRHYKFFIYRAGRRTRSKFMDLQRAAVKAVALATLDRTGILFEVIALPSSRIVAFARRDRRTRVQLYWHTRRRLG
jgi:hypothetical protein